MDTLLIDRLEPGMARLTLSQPKRRNAINAAMWVALPDMLAELATDPTLRVLIVTGAGDHFAAGADISEFGTLYATPESAAKISASIQAAFEALANFPLPTIAQIRGACVGGGCGLALCCDLRFADATARFAITPAKLGLVYPFGDIARLIDAVGVANARDILLSARIIKAKPARRMGLIHRAVKVDELDAEVMDYARNLLNLSPESLRVTKSMINAYAAGQRGDTPETDAQFLAGFSSKDFGEGFRAFLEKRKPDFS
jgi:enoyl-CoA hydratase/carnithine racemase